MAAPEPTPLRRIEDDALIGSTHSAALVHRDGTIDWLCLPRFDADAVFASLLGAPEHGFWRVGAADPQAPVTRRYRADTLVLETTIETETGRASVLDFMPLPAPGGPHEVVWIVEGEVGEVALSTELRLRFGYGLRRPWVQQIDGETVAVSGPDSVRVRDSATAAPVALVNSAMTLAAARRGEPSYLARYASGETRPASPAAPTATTR